VSNEPLSNLLRWHLEMGVDETVGVTPCNRFSSDHAGPTSSVSSEEPDRPRQARHVPRRSTLPPGDAYERARSATSLAALRSIVADFDGCALKSTATNLVFGDGVHAARVVCIGEAPGAEEDRQGLPFVGASGRLLDRMLASVGLDRRSNVFISNTVFWRPPGNRQPTNWEIGVCQPFLERMIELIQPRLLVALGGPAATTLVGLAESVGRLRGRWFAYKSPLLATPIPLRVLFNPAYLLRSPSQKRLAWHDLLAVQEHLRDV
jgi:DNA polymerase